MCCEEEEFHNLRARVTDLEERLAALELELSGRKQDSIEAKERRDAADDEAESLLG